MLTHSLTDEGTRGPTTDNHMSVHSVTLADADAHNHGECPEARRYLGSRADTRSCCYPDSVGSHIKGRRRPHSQARVMTSLHEPSRAITIGFFPSPSGQRACITGSYSGHACAQEYAFFDKTLVCSPRLHFSRFWQQRRYPTMFTGSSVAPLHGVRPGCYRVCRTPSNHRQFCTSSYLRNSQEAP